MLKVRCDYSGFADRVAKHHDFANAQRVLCMMPPLCMSAEEALTFTPHSWRHLYPTAGRQLDLSDTQLEEIGHWAKGSAMPRL